jgi:preprotein translocase subunit SecA
LRAYSQRDPLNEFKVEAYKMFDELKSTIRHDITHTVFRVTLTREPVQRRPGPMIESRPDVTGAGPAATASAAAAGGNGSGPNATARKAGPKIGRNDPCWCGSGKKFKRCHGA